MAKTEDRIEELLKGRIIGYKADGDNVIFSFDDLVEPITKLINDEVIRAKSDMADDILRKVKLEYAGGGRYPGHIIMPWEEIVRPYLIKQLRSKE